MNPPLRQPDSVGLVGALDIADQPKSLTASKPAGLLPFLGKV